MPSTIACVRGRDSPWRGRSETIRNRGASVPARNTSPQTGDGSAASRDGGLAATTHAAPSPAPTPRGDAVRATTRASFVRGSMR